MNTASTIRMGLDKPSRRRSRKLKMKVHISLPHPAIMAMEATAPPTLDTLSAMPCRAAEDRLRHARNKEQIDDEGDEDHRAGNQVRQPHIHRVSSIESLLDEGIQKTAHTKMKAAATARIMAKPSSTSRKWKNFPWNVLVISSGMKTGPKNAVTP